MNDFLDITRLDLSDQISAFQGNAMKALLCSANINTNRNHGNVQRVEGETRREYTKMSWLGIVGDASSGSVRNLA